MAKTVIPRRQGDEFQAVFFWKHLVGLLIEDNLKRVTFESHQQIFVDDVIVEYSEPILDEYTGHQFRIDAYQCKYHVTRSITFSIDRIIDPNFLKNKQSMLRRLYDAYGEYSAINEMFRLHIVSSSGWDTGDPFCRFLSSENHIRSAFWEKGSRSLQGQIRTKLADHLGISQSELRAFLNVVCFDLGMNRRELLESLAASLKLAGLLPLEKTITNTRYAELAWRWLEQGINSFDKSLLEQLVRREKLIEIKRDSLLLIRHQSLDPLIPKAICDDLPEHLRHLPLKEIAMDLTLWFQDGRLTDPKNAVHEQLQKTYEIKQLYGAEQSIELAYYGIAHIPLVFLLGYQLNTRKPINIFEHNRKTNRWDLLLTNANYSDLIVQSTANNAGVRYTDVIIKFGVSYPIIDDDLSLVTPLSKSTIELALPDPRLDAITNMDQLEKYALMFRAVLDEIHNLNTQIERIHVFYAGPVSLAFRCGQLISPTIHPKVLVYNYFSQDKPKYKWGICVNAPLTSPDFLFQL